MLHPPPIIIVHYHIHMYPQSYNLPTITRATVDSGVTTKGIDTMDTDLAATMDGGQRECNVHGAGPNLQILYLAPAHIFKPHFI